MVYAIQAQLAFNNAARRDLISQNIETRLNQTVPWGTTERFNYITDEGDPAVAFTVRFNTKVEADALWTDVQAYVGSGINGPVVGSRISRHDCSHDAVNPQPCIISDLRTW